MSESTKGYVVEIEGVLYSLVYYTWEQDPLAPPRGLLMQGDAPTVFPSKREARAAVRRTQRYAELRGFPWDILDDHVVEYLEFDLHLCHSAFRKYLEGGKSDA